MKIKILAIISFLFLSCINTINSEYDIYIQDEFKIEFSGVVSKIAEVEYSYGIICLKNVKSNTKSFNQRINNKYFCEFKNESGKLLMITYKIQVGDSIVVNKNLNKEVKIYRNQTLISSTKIDFPDGNFDKLFKVAEISNCKN